MWRFPTDDRHVPPGGEFLSEWLDNGKRRTLPHSGLDYSHYPGSPIYVIGPGTVVARGTNPKVGWGYHVWVDHGDIGDGRHAYSYYAHMKALGPKVGTAFRGGEVIGAIGATGSGLTAAHLHWGVALARPADLYKVTIMDARSRDYLTDPAAFVAARIASTAGGGTSPFEPPRTAKGNNMSLYYKQNTSPTLYALAGDSPGTDANWLETTDQTLANQWSAQIGGPSAALSPGSWDNFKAQYLQPVRTAGGGSGGLTSAQDAALMGLPAAVDDLPTKGELTQALTSTVSLVNEHADDNKDEIIASIPSGDSGGSTSAYSLSLNIEQVPGTATGTATPQ